MRILPPERSATDPPYPSTAGARALTWRATYGTRGGCIDTDPTPVSLDCPLIFRMSSADVEIEYEEDDSGQRIALEIELADD